VAALSIAPVLHLVVQKVAGQTRFWRALFVLLLLGAVFLAAWSARSTLLGMDYRQEPPFWERVGAAVPSEGRTIGLVQAYGNLLSYYGWRQVELWPITGELALADLRGAQPQDFETLFIKRTVGMDFFLISSFSQLELQPNLAEYLASHFPIYSQGDGYIIYDLRAPLSTSS